MVGSAIGDVVDDNWSMHMGQGHAVSRNVFHQANLSCEDIVGFVGGVSDVTASEIYKNDDIIGFVSGLHHYANGGSWCVSSKVR